MGSRFHLYMAHKYLKTNKFCLERHLQMKKCQFTCLPSAGGHGSSESGVASRNDSRETKKRGTIMNCAKNLRARTFAFPLLALVAAAVLAIPASASDLAWTYNLANDSA